MRIYALVFGLCTLSIALSIAGPAAAAPAIRAPTDRATRPDHHVPLTYLYGTVCVPPAAVPTFSAPCLVPARRLKKNPAVALDLACMNMHNTRPFMRSFMQC